MEKSFYPGPARWVWLAFFVVLTSALLAGGYAYYRSETERIRQEKYHEIAAIAKLKAEQIQEWRRVLLKDLWTPSRGPFFRKAVEEWLRDPNNSGLRTQLQERLVSEQQSEGCYDTLLLDTEGRILLSAMAQPEPLSPTAKLAIEEALAKHPAVLSDLYRNPQGSVLMDAVAPILDSKGRPIAVLVFRSNAESLLYPLIQSWPTPSRTSETLLVRKEGENVLFLNDLRHRPNAALSLQEPLTLTDLPAVQAVLGKQGMFHGRDYRGVEVLADLRPIDNSPWFMVAKVDAFEILAEARYRGGVTALFAGLFILLAAGVTAYGYRHRQTRLYQDLYRSEREQREAQEQFRTTLYSIGDAVITTDIGGLVKQMNPVAELLTGWPEAEATGTPLDEVFHIVNEVSREEVENPVKRVLREGQVVGLANHTLLIAKDGAERPIADSGAPIRDETGAISGVVLVFRDQTQERMAQQAVKDSEERLVLAMEASSEGVWDWNMTTNEVFRSPGFFSMLGYEAEDFSGRFGEWQNLVHPEDLRLVQHTLEDYIAGKRKTFEAQFRMVGKSGDDVWIVSRGKIVDRDKAGKPLRMIGTHTNVTDRRRSEEELRKSEEKLKSIFRAAPVGIGVVVNRVFKEANDHLCEMTGYGREELLNENSRLVYATDEDFESVGREKYEQIAEKGKGTVETRWRLKDGEVINVLLSSSPIDPADMSLGITFTALDITERKRSEEAIRESEERYRSLFDNMPESLAYCQMFFEDGKPQDFIYLDVNGSFERLTGLKNVVGKKVTEVIPGIKESNPELFEVYGRAALTGNPEKFETYVDSLGIWFYISVYSSEREYFVAVFDNITERKRAEEHLQESEKRYRALFDSAADCIYILDAEGERQGQIISANPAAAEMHGYTVEEMLSLNIADLDTPESARNVQARTERVLKGEAVKEEVTHRRKDGTVFPLEINPRLLELGSHKYLLAIDRDITERKRAEEVLGLSEERYRRLFEDAPFMYVITRNEHGVPFISDCNELFLGSVGYSREEIVGHPLADFYSPESREELLERGGYARALEGQFLIGERQLRTREGRLIPTLLYTATEMDSNGQVIGTRAMFVDITERKRAEGP